MQLRQVQAHAGIVASVCEKCGVEVIQSKVRRERMVISISPLPSRTSGSCARCRRESAPCST